MEFTYSISAKDRLAFETRYQAEITTLWAPKRGYTLLRVAFAIAFCVLLTAVISQPERALAALAIAYFLFICFQSAAKKLTLKYYLKFLESIPGIEHHRTYLDGEYLTTENRGLRMAFSLSATSDIFTEDDFLYIDFLKMGRVRIPLSAFPSERARLDFEKVIRDKMTNAANANTASSTR